MSDNRKRVNPSEAREIDDEALESVAGGCEWGCSNLNSCTDFMTKDGCQQFLTNLTNPEPFTVLTY
jgi:hypothetical protein